jgi:hypothetical protein
MNKEQPPESVNLSVDLSVNINCGAACEFIDKNIKPIIKEINDLEKTRGPYRSAEYRQLEALYETLRHLIKQCESMYPSTVFVEKKSGVRLLIDTLLLAFCK